MKRWDPPCDCVEIQRPTSKKGPKIINADYDDRIVFRVHPTHFLAHAAPKAQTIAYKVQRHFEIHKSYISRRVNLRRSRSVDSRDERENDLA